MTAMLTNFKMLCRDTQPAVVLDADGVSGLVVFSNFLNETQASTLGDCLGQVLDNIASEHSRYSLDFQSSRSNLSAGGRQGVKRGTKGAKRERTAEPDSGPSGLEKYKGSRVVAHASIDSLTQRLLDRMRDLLDQAGAENAQLPPPAPRPPPRKLAKGVFNVHKIMGEKVTHILSAILIFVCCSTMQGRKASCIG
jgi:hypothetical protein